MDTSDDLWISVSSLSTGGRHDNEVARHKLHGVSVVLFVDTADGLWIFVSAVSTGRRHDDHVIEHGEEFKWITGF